MTHAWGSERLTDAEYAAMRDLDVSPELHDYTGHQVLEAYRRGRRDLGEPSYGDETW